MTYDLSNIVAFYMDTRAMNSRAYAEVHAVKNGRIQAGIPLSKEGLKNIMLSFEGAMLSTEILPDNILVSTAIKTVWWNQESYHHLYFSKNLEIPNGCTWLPSLIFKLEGNSLSVVAQKGNVRPAGDTPVFRAPFHNVDSWGNVCMGSTRVKQGIDGVLNQMQTYEAAFWMSEFSHLYGGCPTKTNLNVLFNRLIGTKKKFPKQELLPIGKDVTLEGWI